MCLVGRVQVGSPSYSLSTAEKEGECSEREKGGKGAGSGLPRETMVQVMDSVSRPRNTS